MLIDVCGSKIVVLHPLNQDECARRCLDAGSRCVGVPALSQSVWCDSIAAQANTHVEKQGFNPASMDDAHEEDSETASIEEKLFSVRPDLAITQKEAVGIGQILGLT